jgi:hypothetical protein
MTSSRGEGDRFRDEEGQASAAGGGGGGGGSSRADSEALRRAAEARAAASSSSVLGGDGGGGSSGVDSAAPRRAAEGVSSLPSGVGGGSDRITSERAARILLFDLVEEGLESARAALSKDEKSLSRREARMIVLEETDAQIRALREAIEDRGADPTLSDIASMGALKSIQRKYKNADAREIVDIIARHVSSAAITVAGVARDGALSAADKMQKIGIAVRDFFLRLGRSLTALGRNAAKAVAKGCIKMANGIDTGVVSVANKISDVGLILGNAAARVGAAGKQARVLASDKLAGARHSFAAMVAPKGVKVSERTSNKGAKLDAIDEATSQDKTTRETDFKTAQAGRTTRLINRQRQRVGLPPVVPDRTPLVHDRAVGRDPGHGVDGM